MNKTRTKTEYKEVTENFCEDCAKKIRQHSLWKGDYTQLSKGECFYCGKNANQTPIKDITYTKKIIKVKNNNKMLFMMDTIKAI
jgi:hypothetical protein